MLTTIKNLVTIETNEHLSTGRYLVDKDCPQADIYRVVRKLKDNESPWTAWEEQRSGHACVIEVEAERFGKPRWPALYSILV